MPGMPTRPTTHTHTNQERGMMIDEQAILMLARALADYKEAEWHHRQLRQLPPKITFFMRDGDESGVTVPDPVVSNMLSECDGDIVRVLSMMHEKLDVRPVGDIDMVAVGTEGLGRDHPSGTSVQNTEGSMAHELATDPASKVFRLLNVAVATDDLVGGCDVQLAMTRYRFEDGGSLVWEEPSVTEVAVGPMVDVMQGFFRKADA